MKYIFITGGVCSSLGKGVASASIGTLLESCGLKVSFRKFDGYLNTNAGTMNPEEHGEVYVTDDGTESDLDLGHYYRFTNSHVDKYTSVTAGSIYKQVIKNEERGTYDGECCQIIPHVTDEIKKRILNDHPEDTDVVIVEIGGTVGDVENLIAIHAIRQIRSEEEPEDTCFIHMVHIPRIQAAKEWKTKPAQQSSSMLMGMGIIPDLLFCRIETGRVTKEIREKIINKVSSFCNVSKDNIFLMDDVRSIYEIPVHHWEDLPDSILDKLEIDDDYFEELNTTQKTNTEWLDLVKFINFNSENKIQVGVFGKYINVQDSYKSIKESLEISGCHLGCSVNIEYYSSVENIKTLDGIIIPGGFGSRGTDEKQKAFLHAMKNKIPCLGLCLGFQTSLIAYAREYCGIENAWHEEWCDCNGFGGPFPPELIFHIIEDQKKVKKRSGTMRLGEYQAAMIIENSEFFKAYEKFGTGPNRISNEFGMIINGEIISSIPSVFERHRHRYEFNNKYLKHLEDNGVVFTASHGGLMEACEIMTKDRWFIGTQYHPEYKSKFLHPHPLFMAFLEKCLNNK